MTLARKQPGKRIVVLGARHRTRRSHTRPPGRLILLGYGEKLPGNIGDRRNDSLSFSLSIRCQIGFASESSERRFTNAESAFLQVAEADGNRTRPPRIARRTGFEDRSERF
jgi:hypothetical protein